MEMLEIEQPTRNDQDNMDLEGLDLNALEESCKRKDLDLIPLDQMDLLYQDLKSNPKFPSPSEETQGSLISKSTLGIHHERAKDFKKPVKEDKK